MLDCPFMLLLGSREAFPVGREYEEADMKQRIFLTFLAGLVGGLLQASPTATVVRAHPWLTRGVEKESLIGIDFNSDDSTKSGADGALSSITFTLTLTNCTAEDLSNFQLWIQAAPAYGFYESSGATCLNADSSPVMTLTQTTTEQSDGTTLITLTFTDEDALSSTDTSASAGWITASSGDRLWLTASISEDISSSATIASGVSDSTLTLTNGSSEPYTVENGTLTASADTPNVVHRVYPYQYRIGAYQRSDQSAGYGSYTSDVFDYDPENRLKGLTEVTFISNIYPVPVYAEDGVTVTGFEINFTEDHQAAWTRIKGLRDQYSALSKDANGAITGEGTRLHVSLTCGSSMSLGAVGDGIYATNASSTISTSPLAHALSDPYREAFIQTIVAFMDTYGFDGMDIDWEYPKTITASTGSIDGTNTEFAKYGLLLKGLAEAFFVHGWELAMCTNQSGYQMPDGSVTAVPDFINAMAYGPWNNVGNLGNYVMTRGITICTNRNVPARRIVVGQAMYSNAYWHYGWGSMADFILDESISGCTTDTEKYDCDVIWQSWARTDNNTSGNYMPFTGPTTYRAKCARAQMQGYGGVMSWGYYGDFSTTNAANFAWPTSTDAPTTIPMSLAYHQNMMIWPHDYWAEPSTDSDGYYLLDSEEDWRWFQEHPECGNVRLGADITFTHDPLPVPSFSGVFDGNGHTITIPATVWIVTFWKTGLFQDFSGTAKDLNIVLAGRVVTRADRADEADIAGGSSNNNHVSTPTASGKVASENETGVFAGTLSAGASLSNVTLTLSAGSEVQGALRTGGLVGSAVASTTGISISDVSVDLAGDVFARTDNTGGTLFHLANASVGGLLGHASGALTLSGASVNLPETGAISLETGTTTLAVGGVVGHLEDTSASFAKVYFNYEGGTLEDASGNSAVLSPWVASYVLTDSNSLTISDSGVTEDETHELSVSTWLWDGLAALVEPSDATIYTADDTAKAFANDISPTDWTSSWAYVDVAFVDTLMAYTQTLPQGATVTLTDASSIPETLLLTSISIASSAAWDATKIVLTAQADTTTTLGTTSTLSTTSATASLPNSTSDSSLSYTWNTFTFESPVVIDRNKVYRVTFQTTDGTAENRTVGRTWGDDYGTNAGSNLLGSGGTWKTSPVLALTATDVTTYTRTLSADGDWVSTDAWTLGTNNSVSSATADAPLATCGVTLTLTGDATLTLPDEGATVASLNLVGSGTLTLAGGPLIVSGPLSAKTNLALPSEDALTYQSLAIGTSCTVSVPVTSSASYPSSAVAGHGTYSLTLSGDATLTAPTTSSSVATLVSLPGGATLTLGDGLQAPDLTLEVSGTSEAALLSSGSATVESLTLAASSALTLDASVQPTALTLGDGATLSLGEGEWPSAVTLSGSATLNGASASGTSLLSGDLSGSGTLTLSGSGLTLSGAVSSLALVLSDGASATFNGSMGSGNTFSGTIALGSSGTLTLALSNATTLAGALSGTGTLQLASPSEVTVTAHNANAGFAGILQVDSGATLIGSPSGNSFPFGNTSATVNIASGGTLKAAGDCRFWGNVTGEGTISVESTALYLIGHDYVFTGQISIASGTSLWLSNPANSTTSTLTGPSLEVLGTLRNGSVTLASGKTLSGTGSITSAMTLEDGALIDLSAGTLATSGTLTSSSDATLQVTLPTSLPTTAMTYLTTSSSQTSSCLATLKSTSALSAGALFLTSAGITYQPISTPSLITIGDSTTVEPSDSLKAALIEVVLAQDETVTAIDSLAGTTQSGAASPTVLSAEALEGALTCFTNVASIAESTSGGVDVAVAYDFGIKALSLVEIGGTSHAILTVQVSNSTSTADFASGTSLTVEATTASGTQTLDATEVANASGDEGTSGETGIRYLRLPASALSASGTTQLTVKASNTAN